MKRKNQMNIETIEQRASLKKTAKEGNKQIIKKYFGAKKINQQLQRKCIQLRMRFDSKKGHQTKSSHTS